MIDSIKTDWPNHCAPYMDGYTPEMLADFEQFDHSYGDLSTKRGNYTSQFGEDGLVEAVFDKIGTTNRHCVELGAADGVFFSNTCKMRIDGWSATLIEADSALYFKLVTQSGEKSVTSQKWVDIHALDATLLNLGCPQYPDFMSLDIDGQEFWMWYHMRIVRPRVMLVEHSPFCVDHIPMPNTPSKDGMNQATANYIIGLGIAKGYQPVCRTFCNVLFVDRNYNTKTGDAP